MEILVSHGRCLYFGLVVLTWSWWLEHEPHFDYGVVSEESIAPSKVNGSDLTVVALRLTIVVI